MDISTQIDLDNSEKVKQQTFGHLAPKKDVTYAGEVVYAVGCFGRDTLNPTVLSCNFEGLSDSPWLYDTIQDLIRSKNNKPGCIYEVYGKLKNYKFNGKVRLVCDCNYKS